MAPSAARSLGIDDPGKLAKFEKKIANKTATAEETDWVASQRKRQSKTQAARGGFPRFLFAFRVWKIAATTTSEVIVHGWNSTPPPYRIASAVDVTV